MRYRGFLPLLLTLMVYNMLLIFSLHIHQANNLTVSVDIILLDVDILPSTKAEVKGFALSI